MDINMTLIGQSIAMIVFVWFCMKFIWPPIMTAIEERQKQIAEGLAAAEKGEENLAKARAEADEIVADARKQATSILDQAHARANEIVREVIGFGKPLDYLPPMLIPSVPTMIWGPMIHTVADGLGVTVDDIEESVERLELDAPVDTVQGHFEQGTQGAFRFEVRGIIDGEPRLVVEHITRIAPEVAPQWPTPADGKTGEHRLIVEGRPRLELSIHATDDSDNPADGGNATAAARLVNVVPALVAADNRVLGTLDLPPVVGGGLGQTFS